MRSDDCLPQVEWFGESIPSGNELCSAEEVVWRRNCRRKQVLLRGSCTRSGSASFSRNCGLSGEVIAGGNNCGSVEEVSFRDGAGSVEEVAAFLSQVKWFGEGKAGGNNCGSVEEIAVFLSQVKCLEWRRELQEETSAAPREPYKKWFGEGKTTVAQSRKCLSQVELECFVVSLA